MRVFSTPFLVPKAGNTENEIEDALYPVLSGERKGRLLRFAVADGATEGMLSGKWAQVLVNCFCSSKPDFLDMASLLREAQDEWGSWQSKYVFDRSNSSKPLLWFEEAGLQQGAFSTFVGLRLKRIGRRKLGEWDALALGDSCLFQIREDKVIAKFPFERSSQFHQRPFLISTNPSNNESVIEAAIVMQGNWQVDDSFYLMTDAIAHWFMTECEEGRSPWTILRDLETVNELQPFGDWIDSVRASKEMRNDDVSVVRIDLMLET